MVSDQGEVLKLVEGYRLSEQIDVTRRPSILQKVLGGRPEEYASQSSLQVGKALGKGKAYKYLLVGLTGESMDVGALKLSELAPRELKLSKKMPGEMKLLEMMPEEKIRALSMLSLYSDLGFPKKGDLIGSERGRVLTPLGNYPVEKGVVSFLSELRKSGGSLNFMNDNTGLLRLNKVEQISKGVSSPSEMSGVTISENKAPISMPVQIQVLDSIKSFNKGHFVKRYVLEDSLFNKLKGKDVFFQGILPEISTSTSLIDSLNQTNGKIMRVNQNISSKEIQKQVQKVRQDQSSLLDDSLSQLQSSLSDLSFSQIQKLTQNTGLIQKRKISPSLIPFFSMDSGFPKVPKLPSFGWFPRKVLKKMNRSSKRENPIFNLKYEPSLLALSYNIFSNEKAGLEGIGIRPILFKTKKAKKRKK